MAYESEVLKQSFRANIIDEIYGQENKARKNESFRNWEVYQERQDQYIIEKLKEEFSAKTVKEMRKVTSINLAPRIINELASIYKEPPKREFANVDDRELEQITALYEFANVDAKLKKANRLLKLHNQCGIQIIPRKGIIDIRVMNPHQYDVIASPTDPEVAEILVYSTMDKTDHFNNADSLSNKDAKYLPSHDFRNQKIADSDDSQAEKRRLVWWTKDVNFVTDGSGQVLGEIIPNPMGVLPFIDVSIDKDGEFFVRSGNNSINFALDFGKILSDTANINRLQSYAQALVYAKQQPQDMVIGPNHILFMQLDETSDVQPKFEFANPGSDLNASLSMLETLLKLFLSSKGMDVSAISSKGESKSFASGFERMLAMLEKFEATKDDFDIFKIVEKDLFTKLVAASNAYQAFDFLITELRGGQIDPDAKVSIQFFKPSMIQSRQEQEQSVVVQIENGLMSKVEAIMELRQVDEERAKEIVAEIDMEAMNGRSESNTFGSLTDDQPQGVVGR
jgi:hypothetical protein